MHRMRLGTSALHFGPAHPAAHGVLRCILLMRGEYVVGTVLTLGLLHRGTEKLMEMRHVSTSHGHGILDPIVDHCVLKSMASSTQMVDTRILHSWYGDMIYTTTAWDPEEPYAWTVVV